MTTSPNRPEHTLDATVEHTCDEEYLVTVCDHHGTKATTDYRSFVTYVAYTMTHVAAGDHEDDPGTDCWVCCPDMVVDPARLATPAEAAKRLK
jgi:hypothetical protein